MIFSDVLFSCFFTPLFLQVISTIGTKPYFWLKFATSIIHSFSSSSPMTSTVPPSPDSSAPSPAAPHLPHPAHWAFSRPVYHAAAQQLCYYRSKGNCAWKRGVYAKKSRVQDKDNKGWFCLETNKQDTTSNPYCYNNTQKTQWLWNYTRECADWKCSNSLDSNYAYGYWTGDMISKQLDTTARAWHVLRYGRLSRADVSDTSNNGVRPVITINKSNIK